MRSYIPNKLISIKPKRQTWFNDSCRKAIESREESFKTWCLNKNPITDRLRKKARNICNSTLRREKFLHEQRTRRKILATDKGSKNFWSFVKQVKNESESSIPTLIHNDQPISHSVDKANILASLFAENSFLPYSDQPLPVIKSVNCLMPKLHFRSQVVKKVLLNLNIKKSSGPDDIPAYVLRKCASSLSPPLCKLFHLSYSSGIYPSNWKIANLQRVPKKR